MKFIFSKKTQILMVIFQLSLIIVLCSCDSQKHLGLILDKSLNFNEHFVKRFKACNKLVGSIKCLSSLGIFRAQIL